MSSCNRASLTPQEVSAVRQNDLVLFKNSTIHGMGGFAKRNILRGTALMEYVGEKIDKSESVRRCEANNVFIFYLNENLDLDGKVPWNPARWLNHSCSPNAEANLVNDQIWLFAKRDIEAGEEITFNYGFDLENYRDYPCRCGAPNCVGFMIAEEFFDHVRTANALQTLFATQRFSADQYNEVSFVISQPLLAELVISFGLVLRPRHFEWR